MTSKQAVVLTWGCSHNQKDSQLIEQQLIIGGYNLISNGNIDEADLVVVNTCTVKTPTEDKILHVLDNLRETNQEVVVAGCISQAEPELIEKRYPDFIKLGVNAAGQILAALNIKTDDKLLLPVMNNVNLGKKNNKDDWLNKPALESTQWNPHLNIIPINEGCLNSCTFCATKKARGHLRSYSSESIVNSIRKVKTSEVWLTSQDTACWGFDFDQNLADLIREINLINRKFWARIGMGNPNNLIKVLDHTVEAYKSDKIYKFLHLPVQAGNNRVLNHMKRGYTVEEYEFIVSRFREEIPDITLSTDVICGYPTETKKEFEETITTIRKTRPSITNISRYWERRGTPAVEFKQIPKEERKRRSTMLTKICKEIQMEDNRKWIGWEGEVYLSEEGAKGGIQARNQAYKPIILKESDLKLGDFVKARIIEAKSTYFLGELI
ncbi:MAG: tRNA (N(6)-L-threonylcarbamoyladenosine(37)-C(2))-methylthiotransferase [Candidatus Heimdallarchaeota archaeon]|nr:tRNA (N(6)-L-threonylcarbamoyladenosine(37)-C(2))-methylthiotransferase [Candidatus Heimdallarchaeota archaeon]